MLLYGIHDLSGASLLPTDSWAVETIEIGCDPNDHSGSDFSTYFAKGIRVLARLNYSHHGDGTIPDPARYPDFAQRCANWVRASKGFYAVIIGNEPNLKGEWYGGKTITPQMYADCYLKTWRAIAAVSRILIAPAAIAPWNMDAGHWLDYFSTVLDILDGRFDLIALHTYTHGVSPDLVYSLVTMEPPNDHLYYNFRHFADFLRRAQRWLSIPVVITETDQNLPWANTNSGWVKNAYALIDSYNRSLGKHHAIIALCLYRHRGDQWAFDGKQGVISDFNDAVALNYHTGDSLPPVPIGGTTVPPSTIIWDTQLDQRGVVLIPATPLPGQTYYPIIEGQYYDKQEAQGKVLIYFDVLNRDGKRMTTAADNIMGLVTWDNGSAKVLLESKNGEPWAGSFVMNSPGNGYSATLYSVIADTAKGEGLGDISPDSRYYKIHVSYGFRFQATVAAATPPAPEHFKEGDKVQTTTYVNARKTPGITGKDDSDVLYVLPSGAIVLLSEGPSYADNLTWWNAVGLNNKPLGWIAETTPNGLPLFALDTTGFALYSPSPIPIDNPSPDHSQAPAYLIYALCRILAIEVRLANAFISVESGNHPFGPDGRPTIRFETGVFRDQLHNDELWSQHFSFNPSDLNDQNYSKDGVVWHPIHTGNQADEYTALELAKTLNHVAAMNSASYGAGQIMGFNHDYLSYATADSMYTDFANPQWGYYNQLVGFFSYILNRNGMLDAVRKKDFKQMALLYNGSPSYEALLKDAYDKADS